MDYLLIKSKDNKLYKDTKKLKEKKYRDKFNRFIAEGVKLIELNPNPEYIIVQESKLELASSYDKANTYLLSDDLFKSISSQENSQGVIAVYEKKDSFLEEITEDIIILDRIQDPGNLGTIIRTLDAAGYKDLILVKGSVDVYNEKTVRSTMGSIFNINFYYVSDEELIEFLKTNNYNVIGTALDETSIDYRSIQLKDRNAVIFGNEGNGISEKLLNECNQKAIIPMQNTESLNIAVSAGILMYKIQELKEKL